MNKQEIKHYLNQGMLVLWKDKDDDWGAALSVDGKNVASSNNCSSLEHAIECLGETCSSIKDFFEDYCPDGAVQIEIRAPFVPKELEDGDNVLILTQLKGINGYGHLFNEGKMLMGKVTDYNETSVDVELTSGNEYNFPSWAVVKSFDGRASLSDAELIKELESRGLLVDGKVLNS